MAGSAGQDEVFGRLCREMQASPFHQFLGPQAISADSKEGSVTLRLPLRPEFLRAADDRFVHGGVVATLIDIAGHAAVFVHIDRMAPTIDLRIDYLRPAGGSHLTATAKLLRCGRSVARVDVAVSDPEGCVVAVGRGCFSTLKHPEVAEIRPVLVGR